MRQLLLLIFFCLSKASYCQQASSYQTRFYTTENGLPSNGIKGMQWDEKSKFLWIGTEAGIARFNGIDFKVFSKANLPGSNLERISMMAGSANGNIFAFDVNKQLYKIEENKIHFETIKGNDVLQKLIVSIAPKIIENKIAQKIIEEQNRFTFFRMAKVFIDKTNSCWILDDRNLVSYFPSQQSKEENKSYKEKYNSLFVINDTGFLVTSKNKLNELPIKSILLTSPF